MLGKATRTFLQAKKVVTGNNVVNMSGFKLVLDKSLSHTELNFQRLCALFAIQNAIAYKRDTAMGRVIPAPDDERFKEVFQRMLAPGYQFLYKLFWNTDNVVSPIAMDHPGDKGRYIAGAFMLDWLQECRRRRVNLTLADFAIMVRYDDITEAPTYWRILKNNEVKPVLDQEDKRVLMDLVFNRSVYLRLKSPRVSSFEI